jgi:integrase/recombinase XerD
MPAPLVLEDDDAIVVDRYLAAMGAADRRTGASTTQAARTCQSRIRRGGGWHQLTRDAQLDAVRKPLVHVVADGDRPDRRRCRAVV